jgi:hypothetical protein
MKRLTLALVIACSACPALAETFNFVPSPQTDLNRIYRIDRVTGEIGACQYGLQENSVGVTLCFPAGEGAGRQEPSSYGLVASRHEREGGVFRVDYRSGAMSICYVFEEKVVCTPPEKGALHRETAKASGAAETTGTLGPAHPTTAPAKKN